MGIYHIVFGIVMLFIVTAIFAPMLYVVSDALIPQLRPNTSARAQQVMDTVELSIFFILPIILAVGAILYMFAGASKTEYPSQRRNDYR